MEDVSKSRAKIAQMRDIIKTSDDVVSVLLAWCAAYQVDHVTYHMLQKIVTEVDCSFVRTTYPMEWVGNYLNKGYIAVDQVVYEGMHRTEPFHWSEIVWPDAAREMLMGAQAYGIGAQGYSIPLVDDGGSRALLSMNSSLSPDVWAELVATHADTWKTLAIDVHDRAVREIMGPQEEIRPLARRERECLYLAAKGNSHKEISVILQISDYTARAHLTSARLKLRCRNTAHAVAKATKLRIIGPI